MSKFKISTIKYLHEKIRKPSVKLQRQAEVIKLYEQNITDLETTLDEKEREIWIMSANKINRNLLSEEKAIKEIKEKLTLKIKNLNEKKS